MAFKLDEKLVRQFRDRWQAVAAIEAKEQQAASMELRWQQVNSILRMAVGLGVPIMESSDEDLIGYKRLTKLRNLMK